MDAKYVKEKKSVWEKTGELLEHHWPYVISAVVFIGLSCWMHKKVPAALLLQANNTSIAAASILAAVLITFLVARVVQIRQERIAAWSDYHQLTQKVHHFRGAVYPLFTTSDFWPNGLKYEMEHKYQELTFFDVRKSVFVHATPLSPLAEEFINEGSGTKNLYLQLRSFFKGNVPSDISMFTGEFDSHLYYDTGVLEHWIEFDCGNGLYYYFNHQWAVSQNNFRFNNISPHDRQEVKTHCLRIDPDRYQNVAFGHELYDLLGQQFTSQLLPALYRHSRVVTGGLPIAVNLLAILLTALIPLGIIIPFLVSLELLPVIFSIVSLSGILSLLFFMMLTFRKMLSTEIKI